jgi:hypothetical protein
VVDRLMSLLSRIKQKIIEARKPQTSVQRLLTISGRKPHIIHRCGDGKTISVSDIGPVDLLGWIKPGPSHAFAFVDPRQRFVRLSGTDYEIGMLSEEALRTAESEAESGAWILDHWFGNYYHWVVYCPPKAITLIEAGYGDRILLPSPMSSPGFTLTSLQLLGLETGSLPTAGMGRTHYPSLHVVEGAAATAGGLERLRSRMHAACNVPAIQNDRDIPVACIFRRAVNNPRILSNEQAMLSICREFGIQIIDTAGLPFSDQVRMFAGMKAIIGVHGAGLANMTWMPAGGFAVEITPPPNGSTCFRELAEMLGHHYIQIGTLASHSEIGADSESFTIDPAGFRHAMAAVLSQLRIQ